MLWIVSDFTSNNTRTEMKPYLLIAGDNYYPCSKTGDWIECYETEEEAEEKWEEITSKFKYRYDWYEIVDLRNWMNR
jgi:hypothetical protein